MISDMLTAGFGHIDITPAPIDGPDGFRVFDPISFRATILRDDFRGRGEAVAFVAGDFFSFEQEMLDMMRVELREIDWLPSENILVSVSHIGGAPVLFPSYVDQPCRHLLAFGQESKFAAAAAEAVRQAASSMQPSRIGIGCVSAPGLHYNRRSRDPEGKLVMSNFKLPYPHPDLSYAPVDDRVYVLRVDRTEEAYLPSPRGAIISFGCHALCNKDKQGHISADYPGAARRVVESAWPGAAVSFLPGAIGDVVPFHRSGRTYECMGNAVGGAALYALERTRTREDVRLTVTHRTVRVPTLARELPPLKESHEMNGQARMYAYGARRAGREIDYTLTAVRLGDDLIMHLPGEVFVATSAAIEQASSAQTTMVLSGPSADIGYLCPPEAHAEGGMEPQFTAVAAQAEAIVRQAACELAAEQSRVAASASAV